MFLLTGKGTIEIASTKLPNRTLYLCFATTSSRLAVQEYCSAVVSATTVICLHYIRRRLSATTKCLAPEIIESVFNSFILLMRISSSSDAIPIPSF